MNKPNKTVTTIGVVAFVIAAAITGISAIPGDRLVRVRHPVLLFIGVFLGVFLLGFCSIAPRRTRPVSARSSFARPRVGRVGVAAARSAGACLRPAAGPR